MITIPAQLAALQPESSAAFQHALGRVLPYTDTDLLELCREQLLATQQRRAWQPPASVGDRERRVLALADQFAVAVDGVSDAQLGVLAAELGSARVDALCNALYLLDMGLRLEQVAPVVLADAPAAPAAVEVGPGGVADEEGTAVIADVIADFAAAAVRADGIDALTGELVRLRCAQVHHCRLCGSLRQRNALEDGFEEPMTERLARYEQGGFSAAAVAALHLVDALIMAPGDAGPDLKTELDRHYTGPQIAELCFDVVKWSQQKALVAMHSDAPPWEGIHVLDFDELGHPLFKGPLAQVS
jgi:alkylhydroperoxidase family enzyme